MQCLKKSKFPGCGRVCVFEERGGGEKSDKELK